MKPTLIRPVQLIILAPFLVVAVAWLLTHGSVLGFVISLALLAPGLLLASLVGGKHTNWALFFGLLFYAYPLGETVLYVAAPPLSATGFNNNAIPDSIRGYRWQADSIRYFKHRMGELVFENTFSPNEQGWIMHQDYAYHKADSSTRRWMLFGNSFSAGIMLSENMPNRIQQHFDDTHPDSKSELYSFSLEGIGLMNWHSTFNKEVIPQYEFDGVILCVYEDNLYRGFTVMQMKEGDCFIVRTDSADWHHGTPDFSAESSYDNSNFYYPDQRITDFIKQPPKPFKWPLKNLIFSLFKTRPQLPSYTKEAAPTMEGLRHKLGHRKFRMLKEMVEWCNEHNKPLILASIPAKQLLLETTPEHKNWHQIEMELIAQTYELPYFDGYEVFKNMSSEELDAHWLKYDGHWNQKGSDLFADTFAQYLLEFGQTLNL